MSREALDEFIIRTAQVTSVHDIELRELKTMYRRVTMGANSNYGTVLREVDENWKRDRGSGRPLGASKHVRLAVALLGKIHEDPKTSGEVKAKLEEVFGNVDGSRDEGVAQWLQVVKWRTFKGDREGILEFKLVPELGTVEGEIVRVLVEHGGVQQLAHAVLRQLPALGPQDQVDLARQTDAAEQELGQEGLAHGAGRA